MTLERAPDVVLVGHVGLRLHGASHSSFGAAGGNIVGPLSCFEHLCFGTLDAAVAVLVAVLEDPR